MNYQRNNDFVLKKGDYIIIAAVLLVAGIAVLFILTQSNAEYVVITADGKRSEYSLHKDREIIIAGKNGEYNRIVVEGGCVYMKEASCRNQICVHHKKINKDGESIMCLPNNVIIVVNSNMDSEIDN